MGLRRRGEATATPPASSGQACTDSCAQYVGYAMLVWGFVLTGLNWVSASLGALATVGFVAQMRIEERHLLRALGEEYERYMEAVPRANLLSGVVRRMSRNDKNVPS